MCRSSSKLNRSISHSQADYVNKGATYGPVPENSFLQAQEAMKITEEKTEESATTAGNGACVQKKSIKTSSSCNGDDCKTSVSCGSGKVPLKCEAIGHGSGDGAYWGSSGKCVAQGAHHGKPIKARITCGTCGGDFKIATSQKGGVKYHDQQTVIAKCPTGYSVQDCSCNSPWTAGVCKGTSKGRFSGKGNKCSLKIGVSGGRRRHSGWGAGALITAVCSKDPEEPQDTTEPAPDSSSEVEPDADRRDWVESKASRKRVVKVCLYFVGVWRVCVVSTLW